MSPKEPEDVISRVDIVLPKKVVETCHGLDPGIGAEFLAMNYQKGTTSRMKLFKQFDESVRLSLIVSKLQLYSGPEHILIQGVRKPQAENIVQAENFNALGMKTDAARVAGDHRILGGHSSEHHSTTSIELNYSQSSHSSVQNSMCVSSSTLPAASGIDTLAGTIDAMLSTGSMLSTDVTADDDAEEALPEMNAMESVINDGTVSTDEMMRQDASVMDVVSVADPGGMDVIMEQEVVSTEAVVEETVKKNLVVAIEMASQHPLSDKLVLEEKLTENTKSIILCQADEIVPNTSSIEISSDSATKNVEVAPVEGEHSSFFLSGTEMYSISRNGNPSKQYFENNDGQLEMYDTPVTSFKVEVSNNGPHAAGLITSESVMLPGMKSFAASNDASQTQAMDAKLSIVKGEPHPVTSTSDSLPSLPNILMTLGAKHIPSLVTIPEKRKRRRPLRFQDAVFVDGDQADVKLDAEDQITEDTNEHDPDGSDEIGELPEEAVKNIAKVCHVTAKRPHYKRERNIACPICPAKLKDYDSVSDHLRLKHSQHRDLSRYLGEIKPHMKVRCEACGKVYSSKDQLQAHTLLMHQRLQQAKCQECGLVVKSDKHLKGHMKRVHGSLEHMYLCHLCPASFRVQAYLSTHLKYVHGKPTEAHFECDVCYKKYTTEKYLINHQIRVHGEKRHVCQYCSKAFTTSCNMKRHMLLMHEKSNIKPNKCHSCPKSFALKANLKDHIRIVHERNYNFHCDICGAGFRRKKEYEVHKASHNYNSKFVTVPADMMKYTTVESSQLLQTTDDLTTAEVQLNNEGNNVLTIIESHDESGQDKVGDQSESVQYIIATPDMLHAFGIKLDADAETVIEDK